MLRSAALVLGVILLFGHSPCETRAETPLNGRVEIFPAFQDIVLTAGEDDAKRTVTVRNGTDGFLSLSLSVVDFGTLDESGGVAFLGQEADIERRYGLASWLSPESDRVEVAPGGEAKVTVTVENRDTLGPGGHYGAVLFRVGESGGQTSEGRAIIGVNQIFSSLFFVRKEGGARPELALVGWELPSFAFTVPRTMGLRFQNTGNVHVIPRGLVTVEDAFGRVVARGIVNTESAFVFPESFRKLTVAFQEEGRVLVPGRYTVTIATRLDEEEDFSVQKAKIDIIPLPATLLFVALIGALGWVYARRSRRKQGERKASDRPTE